MKWQINRGGIKVAPSCKSSNNQQPICHPSLAGCFCDQKDSAYTLAWAKTKVIREIWFSGRLKFRRAHSTWRIVCFKIRHARTAQQVQFWNEVIVWQQRMVKKMVSHNTFTCTLWVVKTFKKITEKSVSSNDVILYWLAKHLTIFVGHWHQIMI